MTQLSSSTYTLLQQLQDDTSSPSDSPQGLSLKEMSDVLSNRATDNLQWSIRSHERLVREELGALLLQDLARDLLPQDEHDAQEPVNISWFGRLRLYCLGFFGAVSSLCAGFDGSVSILSLFVEFPIWLGM